MTGPVRILTTSPRTLNSWHLAVINFDSSINAAESRSGASSTSSRNDSLGRS